MRKVLLSIITTFMLLSCSKESDTSYYRPINPPGVVSDSLRNFTEIKQDSIDYPTVGKNDRDIFRRDSVMPKEEPKIVFFGE